MHYLSSDLTEQQLDLRQRVTAAVIDAVIDASAGGEGAEAAMIDMPTAIDGVATAIAAIAANVPEFRSQRGARLLADDVREVVKGMIRRIADAPDAGRSMQFAWPVGAMEGRA